MTSFYVPTYTTVLPVCTQYSTWHAGHHSDQFMWRCNNDIISCTPHAHCSCSSTQVRSLLTFPSSSYISSGPMPVTWPATSSKTLTSSSSLLSMCSTITLVVRRPPFSTPDTVAASWTRPLGDGYSRMSHVRIASES